MYYLLDLYITCTAHCLVITQTNNNELLILLLLPSSILLVIFYLFGPNSWFRKSSKLPPGPFPLPIIGNILHLGRNSHRSLAELSKTYGPLMHLKLGSIQTVVASSPEMAKEILQKHDLICSGRSVPCAARPLNHDQFSIAWLPVGTKWRALRRICKEHMFTMQKLVASEGLRQEKLQQLRDYVEECCSDRRVVNIEEVAFVTSLNLISSTLFSVDFASFHSSSTQEIMEIMKSLTKILGTPNVSDYFPVFKSFNPQGLERKAEACYKKILELLDEIISKRSKLDISLRKNDLLQVLLDLNYENDSYVSHNDIKHLFQDLIIAGADSSTTSVHWAMTELLRNPEKMRKAKDELKRVIGKNKQVEECDISRLPYLNAVIKETFRCHPPAPFLVPHKAEADVEINGYRVPKDAQILVNAWAIGKDSRIWLDPDSFEPERFLDSKIHYKGQDFEFITFGSGRRACPGMPLADIMVHLMVANMVHNYEWKLEKGIKPDDLDMNEAFGLTLYKAVPLHASPSIIP